MLHLNIVEIASIASSQVMNLRSTLLEEQAESLSFGSIVQYLKKNYLITKYTMNTDHDNGVLGSLI